MLNIPKQYRSLEFIRPIGWSEVFGKWRKLEAWQEPWKKHWEERGYASWDEWRKHYSAPLEPEKLEWFLFEIKKPTKELPFFCGVPSKSWIEKAYNGEKTKQLKDILDLPIISENPKVLDIKKKFPKKTMLTGIVFQDKIVLIEGMHRACALASWDASIPFDNEVTLALAKWGKDEIPAIGSGESK
jgi:hypothetical protein